MHRRAAAKRQRPARGRTENDRFPALAQELLAASGNLHEDAAASASPPAGDAALPARRQERSSEVPPPRPGSATNCAAVAADLVLAEQHGDVMVGQIVFQPNLPLVSLKAQLLASKLANAGEIRYLNPPAERDGGAGGDRRDRVRRGDQQERGSRAGAVASGGRGERGDRAAGTAADRGSWRRSKLRPAEPGAKPAETLRVDIERLDELMNLAGQLVIGKARITQIGERLKKSVSEKDFGDARDGVGDLFEAIHLLDRISDGIQQGVMNMRMLPIGPLFSRFHRVIRDLTRANRKEIHLEISGESTELDKRMIDELGDPMIHIVRNAADHGIESPEARVAAGKPRYGTIKLCAFHRGSNIIIQVSDDGRGLDNDRILAKAIERGLDFARGRRADDAAGDSSVDLAARLEHGREGDGSFGPRGGHGHRPHGRSRSSTARSTWRANSAAALP